MGYSLSLTADLSAEVSRVERQELEQAYAELETPDARAVHEARKHLKKLRALLEAVRPSLNHAAHEQRKAQLRSAADALAGARDRAALGESFDRLADSMSGRALDVSLDGLAKVRGLLFAGAPPEAENVSRARELLVTLLSSVEERRLELDVRQLVKGVADTYGRGRKRFRGLRADASGEAFHDLRRQVKHHQHHLALVEQAWPDLMAARRGEAQRLSETLGRHHDLMLLEMSLAGLPSEPDSAAALEAARLHVPLQRAELEAEALALAARLYVERRAAFGTRMAGYVALAPGGPAEP